MAPAELVSAVVGDGGCVVGLTGRDPTTIGWRWLREHDQTATGLDPRTGQRRLDSSTGPASPTDVEFEASFLRVTWADGHQSEHQAATLDGALADRRRLPEPAAVVPMISGAGVEPWPAAPDEIPVPVDYSALVTDAEGLTEALRRLRRSGWTLIDGVPPGTDAVATLVSRIGYVRHTIFGGIWELAADLADHADTAYSTSFIGPHTDGTYSHDGPGAQIFVCQQRAGAGGESILVDGFAAAEMFASTDPEGARVLATLDVPCRYVEPGVSLRAERPVLRCDHAGRLVQVSLNAYDRAPFLLADPGEWERFADGYDGFSEVVADQARWLRLDWMPGRLLMLDNWRVLHGRESFTGSRRFLGCYLNHEDVESAWRVHAITA